MTKSAIPSVSPGELLKRSDAIRSKNAERLEVLNANWRAVEKHLLEIQHPRSVYVVCHTEYYGDPNDPSVERDNLCIGLAKYSGKWRLCKGEFRQRHAADLDNRISWQPIVDATIEDRVHLARHVQKLEREIIESGETFLSKIEEAIHLLDMMTI